MYFFMSHFIRLPIEWTASVTSWRTWICQTTTRRYSIVLQSRSWASHRWKWTGFYRDFFFRKLFMDVASVHEAFHVVCRAGVRSSRAFSIFGLWLIAYLTIMLVWNAFMLSSTWLGSFKANDSSLKPYQAVQVMTWFAINLLALVTVCLSADLPARQMSPGKRTILSLMIFIGNFDFPNQIAKLRQRLIALSHRAHSDRKKLQVPFSFDESRYL